MPRGLNFLLLLPNLNDLLGLQLLQLLLLSNEQMLFVSVCLRRHRVKDGRHRLTSNHWLRKVRRRTCQLGLLEEGRLLGRRIEHGRHVLAVDDGGGQRGGGLLTAEGIYAEAVGGVYAGRQQVLRRGGRGAHEEKGS